LNTADESVLDRIDVTIVDVARAILVVANEMFPKSSLPDASLTARLAHFGACRDGSTFPSAANNADYAFG
jgi:hypothetical protein